MRVHHLNCGTMCPLGGKLLSGAGSLFESALLVCHCLLIETDDGLVLVDTGFGLDDVASAGKRLGTAFMLMSRARLDVKETAARQIERLGFKREDVRHIVPTHLDFDHAGGLADFPNATVHIFDRELDAALKPQTYLEQLRYRKVQWAHRPRWDVLSLAGDTWKGFECVRAIGHVGTDVLLVPLTGHTRGHCGVAVKNGDRWLLHGGDAFFSMLEMQVPLRCPPALEAYQRLLAVNGAERLNNRDRLRALVREAANDVDVLCAHCPTTFDRLVAASSHPRI